MDEGLALDCLSACGLPQAWANQAAWTLLDTNFLNGHAFLLTWLAWRRDPQRPRMLHYVGIAAVAPIVDLTYPLQAEGDGGEVSRVFRDMAAQFQAQCRDMGAGFRRILFEGGQVSLTLSLGEVHTVLGEHVFQADTLFAAQPSDKWVVQSLARHCKRGTRLWVRAPSHHLSALMDDAGFQWDASSGSSPLVRTGVFNPRWEISSSRSHHRQGGIKPARCAVIGAGISGASVAHALALRGWQVTVFDQEVAPASGASGLPIGLAVPHVSADDNPRSRLSRSGIHLLLQHAQCMLVDGQDWERSGVMECKKDAPPLWHPEAAWIKPARLVQAWLSHPAITFVGKTQVVSSARIEGLWIVRDAQQQELGPFEMLVLANAMGCSTLLNSLPMNLSGALPADPCAAAVKDKIAALQAVHGTLSHGTYAESIPNLPATPVNGNGCFIPHVPGDGDGARTPQWFVGSTFETDAIAAADTWAQHSANMARLAKLLPMGGTELAETLDRGPVAQWSATRCVTHDRLPLVGPMDPKSNSGLWLCVGMGSRGLSFAALCAELLVARLGGEPLPMEFNLARSLDLHRVRRRRSAKVHTNDDHTF